MYDDLFEIQFNNPNLYAVFYIYNIRIQDIKEKISLDWKMYWNNEVTVYICIYKSHIIIDIFF